MEPFIILGKRYLDTNDIMRRNLIPNYEEFIDYRSPREGTVIVNRILSKTAPYSGDRVDKWHQDADGSLAGLILWSNIYPTEVLLPDGRVVAGEPYDVVLIDNKVAKHRIPSSYMNDPSAERHFMRSMINYYPTLMQIGTWVLDLKIANKQEF